MEFKKMRFGFTYSIKRAYYMNFTLISINKVVFRMSKKADFSESILLFVF